MFQKLEDSISTWTSPIPDLPRNIDKSDDSSVEESSDEDDASEYERSEESLMAIRAIVEDCMSKIFE